MYRVDTIVRTGLLVIAASLGMVATRLFFDPPVSARADSARFDHVEIISPLFLYKGAQGLLVWDRRNGNVWFIPKQSDSFKDPVFVTRVPFEKLDHVP